MRRKCSPIHPSGRKGCGTSNGGDVDLGHALFPSSASGARPLSDNTLGLEAIDLIELELHRADCTLIFDAKILQVAVLYQNAQGIAPEIVPSPGRTAGVT